MVACVCERVVQRRVGCARRCERRALADDDGGPAGVMRLGSCRGCSEPLCVFWLWLQGGGLRGPWVRRSERAAALPRHRRSRLGDRQRARRRRAERFGRPCRRAVSRLWKQGGRGTGADRPPPSRCLSALRRRNATIQRRALGLTVATSPLHARFANRRGHVRRRGRKSGRRADDGHWLTRRGSPGATSSRPVHEGRV